MPTIRFDESFRKSVRKFSKNNINRKNSIKKTLLLFQENPKHPSLNTEKLTGTQIWTIRVDKGNRLFFTWAETDNTAIFFFVGPHDTYKTIKNKH